RVVATGFIAAACAACIGTGAETEDADSSSRALEAPTVATLPAGGPPAEGVAIAGGRPRPGAPGAPHPGYIHPQGPRRWYWKSGNYLLGIESFVQYSQELDRWVDLGKGGKVAPQKARIVGHDHRGQGWDIPSLDHGGSWPARADSVWIVGTDGGILGMGG